MVKCQIQTQTTSNQILKIRNRLSCIINNHHMLNRLIRPAHFKVAIVGAGCGGINISGHLNKHLSDIALFDPSSTHTYQPGQTMVAGNIIPEEEIHRPMQSMVDKKNKLIKFAVSKILPQKNTIVANDTEYTYDHLVLTSGVRLAFDQIQGAQEALDDPQSAVSTIYKAIYASKWNHIVKTCTKANPRVLFTQPPPPIKCAGAPQKIIHLTFDRLKHLSPTFKFLKAGGVVFGVEKYSQILQKLLKEKKIDYALNSNLVQIKHKEKKAVFKTKDQTFEEPYDLLHLVPHQQAHSYISESGLADSSGFVDIDKQTMRSNKYKNVWALGDCSNTPNSKTAAAIMSQGPVLAQNIVDVIGGKEPSMKYDGYASCPIFIGNKKLVLAEFLYGGKVDETFGMLFDQGKGRYPFYLLKTKMFPFVYWHLMPKGRWMGRKGISL